MAIVGELLTVLTGHNAQLLASVAQSEAALKGYSTTASTHHGIVSGALHAAGIAALGFGVATGVATGLAVKSAGDFQEQMAIINTIAHQTPAELTKTGDAIRAMSVATGTPLNDMTKAFYDLLSAGIPVSHTMAILKDSTTLAIGGLATTAQTVDLLTTAINTYHLSVPQATVATDQFALAVQNGKVTADQIAATFADIAPIAKQAGIGIDEIAAGYAHFTANGVPAAEFTTQMNRAIVELLKPNKDLRDLQKETGKNFADIASHQGLVVALQQMREAAAANGVPFQDLFGRLEGFKFALQTTGPEFKNYESQLTQMHSATGTASDQAAERMGTFSRQTAILGQTLNNLLITVGTPLLPFVTSLVENITAGIAAVTDWADQFPNLGAAMGSLAQGAAAALGDFIAGLPAQLQTLAAAFVDWIGPMIGPALAALGQFAAQVGAWIVAQLPGWVAQIGAWASAFVDWIGPMIPKALAALGQAVSQFFAWAAAQAPGWLAALLRWADAFIAWVSPMIPKVLAALAQLAVALIGWIIQQLPVVAVALGKLAIQFVEWVLPQVPKLVVALGQFAVALLGWIVGEIPVIAAAMLRWAAAFIGWIIGSIPGAIAALGQWLLSVLQWMATVPGQLAAAAVEWGKSIAHGVIEGIGNLPAAIGSAVGGALTTPSIPRSQSQYNFGGHFAQGGTVPGSPGQAQLIVAHGGETVTPPGGGSGEVHVHVHNVIELEGDRLMEFVETHLLRNAGANLSGLVAGGITAV